MSKLLNLNSFFSILSRRYRRYRRDKKSCLSSDSSDTSSEANALDLNSYSDVESINDSTRRLGTQKSNFTDSKIKFLSSRVDSQKFRSLVPLFQSFKRSVYKNNSFAQKNYFYKPND